MKGLLLAIGLIAALFVSNAQASVFDTASYLSPEINSVTLGGCNYNYGQGIQHVDPSTCSGYVYSSFASRPNPSNISYTDHKVEEGLFYGLQMFTYYIYQPSTETQSGGFFVTLGRWIFESNSQSKVCPPKSNPKYTFSFYNLGESEVSKCYDPAELDNASKCADLFNSGSILTAGSNTSSLVCKTFDDGSRCAFSRVEQGSTPYYQPNLEKGCFGDAEEIPDYDKDTPPSPQPEQCTPYFGGFACAADPKNYCSSTGICVDGCGYVNDQFICFRDEECKGASCEPAPVNCETVPDAPICKDKETIPEPTFCEKNPTVESCQSGSDFCKKNPLSPSCQLGGDGTGSGGSKFVLDYDKLIQGMKDAANTLIDPNSIPDNTAMDKSLDDENKAIKSDYDNFLNDGVFSEIRNTSQRPIFSSLETLFPTGSGTCSFNFGKFSIEICSTAEKLREILYWVFSILTLIYLRHLFYQTIRTSAGK